MAKTFSAFFIFCFLLAAHPTAVAATRWEGSAHQRQELAQNITWFNHEPFIFPLRRGGHFENWPEIYDRQHSVENILRMAKAGVRYGRLHFYKGMGLRLEMPEILKARQTAERMHAQGMKVSLYVGGTMFAETFYREVPEAREWEQRDQLGRWVPYMETQTFRHYPCPNEPAYRDYIKKVLKIGVEQLGADQFFFDNVQLQPEPKSCRCPRCLQAFQEFLRRRYPTREAVERRFGYPDVQYLAVNEWEVYNRPEDVRTVDDPVLQEWIRFRCESLAHHNNDLADYIKSLNPDISVGFNLKGLYGFNRMWLNGIYHPLYQGHSDFICFDVDGVNARLDSRTGALVSEIRSYKMARRLNMSCHDFLEDDLRLAVHMAFNFERCLPRFGYQGGPWDWGANSIFTPLMEFFREYSDRYYTETENRADVAVLRSWPSMAYSIGGTLVPTILMEQVLIQHQVPFDILFDEQLNSIDRYAAVILPGQEALSRQTVDRLLGYVRAGGTLVFSGNTARYNEWREERQANPLLSRFGKTVPAKISTITEGQGKLVYIPELLPTIPPGSQVFGPNPEIISSVQGRDNRFSPAEWTLPANHAEIHSVLVAGLRQGLSLESAAPLTTVAEICDRPATAEIIVHFVNFDRTHSTGPFSASVRVGSGQAVRSVRLFSPESDDPQRLPFTEVGSRVRFTVPPFGLYAMIVIS
jgi:hypothetical protein